MIADTISFIVTLVDGDGGSRCRLDFFSRQDTEALTARFVQDVRVLSYKSKS